MLKKFTIKTLKHLIKDNEIWLATGYVAFCNLKKDKIERIPILNLTLKQLSTLYKESEWWLDEGDLCLLKKK